MLAWVSSSSTSAEGTAFRVGLKKAVLEAPEGQTKGSIKGGAKNYCVTLLSSVEKQEGKTSARKRKREWTGSVDVCVVEWDVV